MWWRVLRIFVNAPTISIVLALFYGRYRWKSNTRILCKKLDTARVSITPKSYDSRELARVPPPVRRYFAAVLQEGQPFIIAAKIQQTGTFNMSENREQWKAFQATQHVILQRPGFVWDARIRLAPGITAFVHDAYTAGEGTLHATLFGFLTVMKQPQTHELAESELMRFLAEGAWYPTIFLPGQGVQWETIDDTSARAILQDGAITLTMLFRFNKDDLIESIRVEARGRIVSGTAIPTPWEGRWSNYELHHGIRIPTQGEVMWITPEGPKPYWCGHVTKVSYEFA